MRRLLIDHRRHIARRSPHAALALLATAAITPIGAFAHHSAAIFATDSVIVLDGTISKFTWTNPHVYLYLDVRNADGTLAPWLIETDPIPILVRNGWTSNAFKPGDVVTVRANPEKDPSHRHALLVSVARADGAVFTPRAEAHRFVARADGIAGVWDGLPGYATRKFVYGALTEKGAAGQAAYTEADNPVADCIPYPSPSIVTAPYLSEIEVRDDSVVIRSEFFGVERIVYTDGRPHPANGPRTVQGHSIGRWDAGALVVDTTLFADYRGGNREGIPSGAQKHVVERYALSDDHTQLHVTFTVEDPEFLAEPMTGSIDWDYAPDRTFAHIGCDPEIAKRYILQ
jgi:Family of unknown function (DUF6152)